VDGDAELLASFTQDREQPLPADRGKAMPSRGEDLAVVVHIDVVPGRKVSVEALIESGVSVLDTAESLVGKDDAEPKCVVSRVSLPDLDLVLRVQQLDQRRQVEPCRPAADDRDAE
jgi:hypothetical protein